jgi:8-amino-7-oxononanoate synthase
MSCSIKLTEVLCQLKQAQAERSAGFCTSALLDFASNDYLSLTKNAAWQQHVYEHVGSFLHGPAGVHGITGSTGSRVISGSHPILEQVEEALCLEFGSEAALVFPSGYQANLALMGHLGALADVAIYDQYCHASIRHGLKHSGVKAYAFRHNDFSHLEDRLKRLQSSLNKVVIAESLYSMDGDFADAKGLLDLCRQYNAQLILDEAHTFGWHNPMNPFSDAIPLNPSASLNRVWPSEKLASIVTFGKAIGAAGAAVVGSRQLIKWMLSQAHPAIYSTAPSPLSFVPVLCALQSMAQPVWLEKVTALHGVIEMYREEAARLRIPQISANLSPIQFIKVPGNVAVLEMEGQMKREGFFVKAIRSPTVPRGSERIRISLHTDQKTQSISDLLNLCEEALG